MELDHPLIKLRSFNNRFTRNILYANPDMQDLMFRQAKGEFSIHTELDFDKWLNALRTIYKRNYKKNREFTSVYV